MSRDIFISYSHADQTIANKVCQRLEEAGFSCWISSRDELPGEQWAEMIARGVDESKIVSKLGFSLIILIIHLRV